MDGAWEREGSRNTSLCMFPYIYQHCFLLYSSTLKKQQKNPHTFSHLILPPWFHLIITERNTIWFVVVTVTKQDISKINQQNLSRNNVLFNQDNSKNTL